MSDTGVASTTGPLDVRALRSRSRRSGPWQVEDLVRVATANAVALVLVLTGWFQATQADGVRDRLTWLNLALVGLLVSGAGNASWLLQGRRSIGLARIAILPSPVLAGTGTPTDARRADEALVTGPGMAHFHRASCTFATGRSLSVADREEHEAAGLAPCGVCEP